MKEINIDRVCPLNSHHNIDILHDFNPLKSFTFSNASLNLHLSRSLILQLCLDNSGHNHNRKTVMFVSATYLFTSFKADNCGFQKLANSSVGFFSRQW